MFIGVSIQHMYTVSMISNLCIYKFSFKTSRWIDLEFLIQHYILTEQYLMHFIFPRKTFKFSGYKDVVM